MKKFLTLTLTLTAFFFLTSLSTVSAISRTKLNFNDVEVLSVVKLMSKVTGRTFLFSERDLKNKKITLLSDQRFTSAEAYRIFEEVLRVNGLSMIDEGKVTRILPSKTAKITPTALYQEGGDVNAGAYVTRVFPIKNANIRMIRSSLSPIISKSAILIGNEEANILILRDTKENTQRFAEIVALIDQQRSPSQIKTYPIQHAEAVKLVGIINKILAGTVNAGKKKQKVIINADPRTNALITVYPNEASIAMVEGIIKDMDQPESAVELEILGLKHATASDLASLVTKIFPAKKGAKSKVRIFSDKRTNNLILIGHPQSLVKIRELVARLDQTIEKSEARSQGNIRVYPLKNANAKKVAEVLQKVAKTFGGSNMPKGVKSPPTTIIPDEPTNSLVIYSEAANFPVIEDVINRLDVVRPQVFIQVLIMEVKLDKSLDLGIQWQAGKLVNQGSESGGFATVGGVGATGGPKTVETTLGEGAGSVVGIIGNPITFGGKSYASFNAFIKASQSDTEIDILSSPQILTLNKEEAEIKVGEIIPTTGSTKVDTNGNATTTIEYKEVGISLKITPQINADGSIELEIDETSSNVVEGTIAASSQGAITTLNRSIKTKVIVRSGETIALGGLISDEITQVENKTPCLGDIPIVGWLFKFKETKTRKTNLMIFLKPTVVRTKQDLAELTEGRKEAIKRSRNNRFRIDISNEYNISDIIKGQAKELLEEEEEQRLEAEEEAASEE